MHTKHMQMTNIKTRMKIKTMQIHKMSLFSFLFLIGVVSLIKVLCCVCSFFSPWLGLNLWNQTRQQWLASGSSQTKAKVREPTIRLVKVSIFFLLLHLHYSFMSVVVLQYRALYQEQRIKN